MKRNPINPLSRWNPDISTLFLTKLEPQATPLKPLKLLGTAEHVDRYPTTIH
jgi:hypothetical protein